MTMENRILKAATIWAMTTSRSFVRIPIPDSQVNFRVDYRPESWLGKNFVGKQRARVRSVQRWSTVGGRRLVTYDNSME